MQQLFLSPAVKLLLRRSLLIQLVPGLDRAISVELRVGLIWFGPVLINLASTVLEAAHFAIPFECGKLATMSFDGARILLKETTLQRLMIAGFDSPLARILMDSMR